MSCWDDLEGIRGEERSSNIIREMIDQHDNLSFAETAAQAESAFRQGKIAP